MHSRALSIRCVRLSPFRGPPVGAYTHPCKPQQDPAGATFFPPAPPTLHRRVHPALSALFQCKADFCAGPARGTNQRRLYPFRKGSSGRPLAFVMAAVDGGPTFTGDQVLEEDPIAGMLEQLQEHQKTAAQLPPAEEARTVLAISKTAVLSSHSTKVEGYPMGSTVAFAADDLGRPILAISSLSPHTRDLETNPRCSLLFSRDLNAMSVTKVTLFGDAVAVPEVETGPARAAYLAKHPNAFWVDFGDFRFVRVEPTHIRCVSNVGTFAQGASVHSFTPGEFAAAAPDPVAPFEAPIMKHVNDDHEDDLKAYLAHYLKLPKVDSARLTAVDRLGMRVEVQQGSSSLALRLPFPRPAADRRDVKNVLVEMSKEAKESES